MERLQQLAQERRRVLGEIAKLGPMRRGSVCELSPCFIRKDGSRKTRGPYLTYTCKKNGKSVGRHLRGPKEAELYRGQIATRRRFEQLVEEFAQLSEAMADLEVRRSESEMRVPTIRSRQFPQTLRVRLA